MLDTDYTVGPKLDTNTLPFAHLLGTACTGCGKPDPCGVHYEDCTLLEPGDWIVQRGQETAPPVEYTTPYKVVLSQP